MTMRAVVLKRFGGPEEFEVTEVPRPTVGPRQALVVVHAASVNPIDWKIRTGMQRAVVRMRPPMVIGMDISGVVEAVGAEVTWFQPGDEVFASPDHKTMGSYAEYVAVDERQLARKPTSISHAAAATLPLVGLTAWGCLVDAGRVQPGQKVFIQAGSGGVGTFAIQLAKHLGAHVTTTCSERNRALVTSLGADRVIDYTKERFEDVLEAQDVVLESIGPADMKRAKRILRRGGRMSSINSGLDENAKRWGPNLGFAVTIARMLVFSVGAFLGRGIKTSMVVRKPDGERLSQIAELVDSGAIRPVVDKVFPLAETAEAHRYCEQGRTRGKVAIVIRQ